MRIKQFVFISILTTLSMLSFSVFSQELPVAKLDTYFEILGENDKFMGTISVSKDGQNIFQKSVGFSNLELKQKASATSRYMIGSISKTFTAVMIFQAIESGKISLTTTLDRYFPNIKNATTITIDQLLCHRSGIHNFTDNDFSSWSTEQKSRDEMMKIISRGGSDFIPNSKAQYSNSNYVILSYILEIIHKKTFGEILSKSITVPLKLKNTSFGNVKYNDVCNSYKFFDKWRVETFTHHSVLMGAGGILSTANDLNLFFQALFNGELVSQNSLDAMTTIQDGFGKGLFQIPFYTKKGYGHTGGIDGFSSVSIYFPNDKVGYSLTSNGANHIVNNEMSIAVLSAVYDMPFELPDFSTVSYTTEDLDKYLGTYVSSQIPIKITISKRGNILIAQGTGQPSFELDASAEHTFRFEQGGIILVFDPSKKSMTLKQGGALFYMTKE